ncbi:TraY domain-containing protein (plasmid) [Serratia sp. PAMC26656]|uniref:TraY domain-containing protein n=1 Tax=Serratia sp. PAMC26656 TaxID=2775909 RepID=UPI0018F40043|nr:TraY domain-containing protein [Serratia sp. PAMC26656]MBJ7889532.1 TraY domain-containing protein [Serratia sp. PAMC26656]
MDLYEKINNECSDRVITLSLQLGEDVNELLTQAVKRSGRTKRQEVLLRLTDHLMQVQDIAAAGKTFKF